MSARRAIQKLATKACGQGIQYSRGSLWRAIYGRTWVDVGWRRARYSRRRRSMPLFTSRSRPSRLAGTDDIATSAIIHACALYPSALKG